MRKEVAVVLLLVVLLSGCADYLNRYDTVTLAAGDAQKYNAMLQTKDPFNPDSKNTAIDTDGQRIADAVQSYRGKPPSTGTTGTQIQRRDGRGNSGDSLGSRSQNDPGNCECPGDIAADKKICGNRSAFIRDGGRDPKQCEGRM